MKNRMELENRVLDSLDLCGEPMPGMPIVEIAGDNRVLIERHNGIVEYGTERIGVKLNYGQLDICGSDLTLLCMTREQLVISGCIDGITLKRRK